MKKLRFTTALITIISIAFGLLLSVVLFYPKEGNFLYDYQTLVGGLLAFLAVYIALNHKNKAYALKQENIKRIFEIELFPLCAGIGAMYQNLKNGENISRETILEQVNYWCSEIPSVMYDNGLISELNPKDMRSIINMRGHYQELIKTSKYISTQSDEELVGTTYIQHVLFCALAFSSTFDRFTDKVITQNSQSGSKTKWLDI